MTKPVRRHQNLPQPASVFLGVLGTLLLLAAVTGFFIGRDGALIGVFTVVGAAVCVAAVVAPRLEGAQEFGLQGAKINVAELKLTLEKGEKELETQQLPELEEVLADVRELPHQ